MIEDALRMLQHRKPTPIERDNYKRVDISRQLEVGILFGGVSYLVPHSWLDFFTHVILDAQPSGMSRRLWVRDAGFA